MDGVVFFPSVFAHYFVKKVTAVCQSQVGVRKFCQAEDLGVPVREPILQQYLKFENFDLRGDSLPQLVFYKLFRELDLIGKQLSMVRLVLT